MGCRQTNKFTLIFIFYLLNVTISHIHTYIKNKKNSYNNDIKKHIMNSAKKMLLLYKENNSP